ncbi:MAG: methylenetetrahydrofolate reductase C-terminal domain-containing protein [Thermodesulfobacteriota bacterium]
MPHRPTSPFGRSLADPSQFTITFELVPSRGGHSREHVRTLALARELAADPRLKAVSITENAGGQAALSPEVLGLEIKKSGLDVIVHFSSKDKNRNQMESLLFAWDRLGIRDLLVITGDYPGQGYRGLPKPVFDLDSVHVLDLIARMNRGDFGRSPRQACIRPTAFRMGVALSPFKRQEAELCMQYAKLHRKAARGADYIITQVGYDARKFHEAIQYVQQSGLGLPLLGNVFVPNLKVAELMRDGRIPGCVLTDRLYAQMRKEATGPDKGKRARLLRAARLLAILKGLGYSGAHIGGPGLSHDDLDLLLTTAEGYAEGWRELVGEMNYWHEDGFYLYEKDAATGLNSETPARLAPAAGLLANYRMASLVHDLAFEPTGPLYGPCKRFCQAFEGGRLDSSLTHLEHVIKFLLFECQNCGDCALGDLGFICPQSGCAKYLLNGPCGGSRDGWCEVYPGRKRCLYVRAYERLKAAGRAESFKHGFVPPRDWALNDTSSWLNFYRGRDHASAKE